MNHGKMFSVIRQNVDFKEHRKCRYWSWIYRMPVFLYTLRLYATLYNTPCTVYALQRRDARSISAVSIHRNQRINFIFLETMRSTWS